MEESLLAIEEEIHSGKSPKNLNNYNNMRKKDPVLQDLKLNLGVKASSKCLRLTFLINLVNQNKGRPVSKVTVIEKLKITDRTFYRYCKQLPFIKVHNGKIKLAA